MSVSSAPNSKAGRSLFKHHMRKPLLKPSWEILVPSRGTASTQGTAFDYAMRMGFLARWPELARPQSRLIADNAVNNLVRWADPGFAEKGRSRVAWAKARFAEMDNSPLSEEQARGCLQLAYLEVLGRSADGRGVLHYQHLVSEEVTASQIEELQALYDLITWEAFVPERYVALNPQFGKGSELVDGADADIVLDDLLIDIKTTKDTTLKLADVRQVVAYALLANAHGVDGRQVEIERVSIYYSRSAELLCWDLAECVDVEGRAALLGFLESWAGEQPFAGMHRFGASLARWQRTSPSRPSRLGGPRAPAPSEIEC